nr:hypothetical protein [uncultured Fluviicola sp.]
MKTSFKQTSLFTEEELTLSQADSLASRLVLPGIDPGQTTTVTYGLNIYEQYGKFSPLSSLLKTLLVSSAWKNERCSLEWTVKNVCASITLTSMRKYTHDKHLCCSTQSVLILKKKVTQSNRLLFQLRALVHPTEETECGLLPTPTAMDTTSGGTDLKKIDRRREKAKKSGKNGNGFGMSLREMMIRKLLPTPAAQNYKGGSSTKTRKRQGAANLPDLITEHGQTSQLNPRFVMEMMGFPPDWTVLPFQIGETNH